jgi:hypothetical protein
MEIDITRFFNEAAPMDYSASQAEIGANAGPDTWRACVEASPDWMYLDTEDKRQAWRTWARESGGWNADEIAAWTHTELNALFIQWVAGDMRQMGIDRPGQSLDWEQVEQYQHAGRMPSNIFKGDDGHVYFYIGS